MSEYFAIGPRGWGRGSTPQEALDVYVGYQSWIKVKDTVFKRRADLDAYLREQAQVWLAPEGATGFFSASPLGLHWTFDGDRRNPVPFEWDQKVVLP